MLILYKLCICKLSYDKWSFKHAYSFHKTKRWLFKFRSSLFHFHVYWNANIVSTFPHQYLRRGNELWMFSSIDQMLLRSEFMYPVPTCFMRFEKKVSHECAIVVVIFFLQPLYKTLLIKQLCFITMVSLRNIYKKFSTFHTAIVMNIFNPKINKQLFSYMLGRTLQPLC